MPSDKSNKTYDYEDLQESNNMPKLQIEQLEGVRSRRVMAFIADYIIIALLVVIAKIFIAILGIFTFGAAWLLFPPLILLVTLAYIWFTLGGPNQATLGMNFFAIKLVRLDGSHIDGFIAILHSILFWVVHVTLTPVMLLVSMFSSKKRLIQDVFLGTVVIRSDL